MLTKIELSNLRLSAGGVAAGTVVYIRFEGLDDTTGFTHQLPTDNNATGVLHKCIPFVASEQLQNHVLVTRYPDGNGKVRGNIRIRLHDATGAEIRMTGFVALRLETLRPQF